MTDQETFDAVVTHARKQQCKSEADGHCLYRGPGGTMCFAGCLITDYQPGMEGKSLSNPMMCEYFHDRGFNTALISCLQRVHDQYAITDWEFCFAQIAKTYDLQYKEPA